MSETKPKLMVNNWMAVLGGDIASYNNLEPQWVTLASQTH